MTKDIDLLQIKIEKARAELPEESRLSIDAIDWKTVILGMREEKGYSYTQLETLETETELLLCGLLNPEDYPKELEKRMNIPRPQVEVLVNEMNEKVFKKIREELVKNIERKKISGDNQSIESKEQPENLESREELLKHIENPDLLAEKELPAPSTGEKTPSILEQKLSGSFQTQKVETDHSLENISKPANTSYPKNADPYRLPPE
jgi:hypothetical protein